MKQTRLSKEIERRELANKYSPFPVYDTELIEDLKLEDKMITKKDNYNNVPVISCKTCGSLHIKTVRFNNGTQDGVTTDYCVVCSNTEMEKLHIEEWEEKYEELHGESHLDSKEDDGS